LSSRALQTLLNTTHQGDHEFETFVALARTFESLLRRPVVPEELVIPETQASPQSRLSARRGPDMSACGEEWTSCTNPLTAIPWIGEVAIDLIISRGIDQWV